MGDDKGAVNCNGDGGDLMTPPSGFQVYGVSFLFAQIVCEAYADMPSAKAQAANAEYCQNLNNKIMSNCSTAVSDCNTECQSKPQSKKDKCKQAASSIPLISTRLASCGGAKDGSDAVNRTTSATGGGGSGSGSGGGAGSMLGALAGLGAMAAMMAMQKQNQQQQQQQQIQPNGYASPDGVIGADGQPNCSANLAYRYSICNATISSACYSNINNMMSSPICTQFSSRYCNQNYQAPVVYSPYPYPLYAGEVIGNTVVTTPSPQYTTDLVGEGVGSSYCLRALQISFCTNAANSTCPSCMQLASLTQPGCIGSNNPACIQVSSSQGMAGQMNSCPSPDPLLSVPGMSAGTAVAGATTATTTATTAGGPPAVLPTTMVKRTFASIHDGITPTGGVGVTGEVGREMGQSLFSTNSQPIAQRCTNHQLLHCL